MDPFLQVNDTNLLGSPSSSCILDDVTSICPLITPSPPTNALVNPLSESLESEYNISQDLKNKLQKVQTQTNEKEDTSSNSSTISESPNVQFLNHKNNSNNFPFIIKDEENVVQETNGKTQPLQLTFRNPPENYFFMSWNWPLIRKISLWAFLTGLATMVALVVAMIYSLPRICNPKVKWYQGSVFYEIFPASFYDTNNGMTGDFKGISKNVDYIAALGVKVVRLNSIFQTPKYPEDYKNITNLKDIAESLGDIGDFKNMINRLNSKNLSLILDLPIHPLLKKLPHKNKNNLWNTSELRNYKNSYQEDIVSEALVYWMRHGVKGFYLKNLEELVDDPNLGLNLIHWKNIIGSDSIFIISELVLKRVETEPLRKIIMDNVDLIDFVLEIEKGANEITKRIFSIENTTLFTKSGGPWIHWTVGNENTKRLVNRLSHSNSTLGALLLNLMLPGTPSIFYGDEIGLQQIFDPYDEKKDLNHLYQLTPMVWPNYRKLSFSWLHGEKTKVNFELVGLIAKLSLLRSESPSIYMNSVYKNEVNKANAEVKYSKEDLLVIQRWYPRRKSYVVVSNLGKNKVEADLSTLLYRGDIIVGPRPDSVPSTISFKEISLWPGESVVIVLE